MSVKGKRLTQKGLKARRTRRTNQVKARLGEMNIGAKDFKNILEFLTKDVQTKKGLERSRRLEKLLLDEQDFKSLSRFKKFKGLKEIETPTLKSATRILQDDGDFYIQENELIKDYNKLSKAEKDNKRNITRIALEKEYSNYKQQKRDNKE